MNRKSIFSFFLLALIFTTELFSQTIPLNSEVEFCEITWPGDWILCDSYSESEGPMSLRIYRIKNTKQIVQIEETGAYCQGDSEYGHYTLFDEKGFAIFHSSGGNMYVPTIITLFNNSIPELEAELPADEDHATKIIVRKPQTKDPVTTSSVDDLILYYFSKMQTRIDTLAKMKFKKDQWEAKREADSIVTVLKEEIHKGIVYNDGYFYRFPVKGEYATLKGMDIRLRDSPSAKSKVIGKVNGYDWSIEILDIKGSENIDPYGIFPWYKIKVEIPNNTPYEGWIFGAFILPGVYFKK